MYIGLLGALITKKIAWIQLLDLGVWHISGGKHMAVDKLFRRPPMAVDLVKAKAKKDIDNFILTELNSFQVLLISLDISALILVNNYLDNS